MGLVQDFIQRWKERRSRFNDAQEDVNIQRKIQERQMNANERELIRFQEEERQENIKRALEYYRKKKHDEVWHGENQLDAQNLFKNGRYTMGQKNIFGGKAKL